jgi:hypothetical protein
MFVRIDSSCEKDKKLFDMCKIAEFSDDLTAENVQVLDWKNRPETVLNQIFIQKIYDCENGGYFVYEKDGKYVCGVGCYPFEQDDSIAVFPVRLYISTDLGMKERIQLMRKLIQHTFIRAIKDNYRAAVFFLNDHNLWRAKATIAYMNVRKNKYLSFVPKIKTFDTKVNYKFTEQTAMYIDFSDYENEVKQCLQQITV